MKNDHLPSHSGQPSSGRRMLADVLWEAANTYLMTEEVWAARKSYYTCDAAWHACGGSGRRAEKAHQFLKALGCPGGHRCFRKFKEGMQRQGVRYMWLLLAMHVAADEGIEI